ncbi:hypothetical protein SARC_17186, partial [Sphaeroforma arctica JP610]
YMTWVQTLWRAHQKSADFAPDEDDMTIFAAQRTMACNEVCKFIAHTQTQIKASLDGDNATQFITQLASKLQHMQQH